MAPPDMHRVNKYFWHILISDSAFYDFPTYQQPKKLDEWVRKKPPLSDKPTVKLNIDAPEFKPSELTRAINRTLSMGSTNY
jgi:hypothetical protein